MYSQLLSPEPCSCCSMTALSYLTVDISNCFGSAWLPFDVARYSRSLYSLALYMAQVQIVVSRFHGIFLLNVQLCSLAEALGWGVWPLTRGLVGYIIAPTFATFTLSFDNCLPKLWASLYRQLAAMHIRCIFLLKIWMLTCYIILVLYFVSAIIKWPLSTITLCVFCSKLAQGSASMYYIHIEHQQRINVIRNCNKIWRNPFSTYPGKR